LQRILPAFFIALGVVLGGTFVGSIGGIITGQSPLKFMSDIASDLKLYAIISAIGGTFNNLRLLEGSFLQGELHLLFEQIMILISAFAGARLAYWLVIIFAGGR